MQLIEVKQVELSYISAKRMKADFLTKALLPKGVCRASTPADMFANEHNKC